MKKFDVAYLGFVQIEQIKFLILKKMENLLYSVALVFVILWALGFFVYSAGYLIHLLLVVAVIAVLLRLVKGKTL